MAPWLKGLSRSPVSFRSNRFRSIHSTRGSVEIRKIPICGRTAWKKLLLFGKQAGQIHFLAVGP